MNLSQFNKQDRQSELPAFLRKVLFSMYRLPCLRNFVYKCLLRLESGPFFSRSVRRLLLAQHGVSVGQYSYGDCLIPGKLPPGTVVGNYCSIANGISIFRRNHPVDQFSQHPFFYNKALGLIKEDSIVSIEDNPLIIGHDVWIGAGVTILPSCKKIGNGAVVGAASIVTRDIPDFAVVAGNPARLIRYRFPAETVDIIVSSDWWNKSISDLLSSDTLHKLGTELTCKRGSSELLVAEPDGEVEIAEEEEDACAVIFKGSEASSGRFDLLDSAVEAFA